MKAETKMALEILEHALKSENKNKFINEAISLMKPVNENLVGITVDGYRIHEIKNQIKGREYRYLVATKAGKNIHLGVCGCVEDIQKKIFDYYAKQRKEEGDAGLE